VVIHSKFKIADSLHCNMSTQHPSLAAPKS
jgi:hypothetical protein